MARGWESKSVEAQMELASERRSKRAPDAAQRELARQRESLLISRTRVMAEIAECRNPRYKELLTRSLEHLDEQLRALD